MSVRTLADAVRHDWTVDELFAIAELPLLDLVYRAAGVHREHHDPHDVQRATLLSIKTGGCPEDCAYCPQAARYKTGVQAHALLDIETVLTAARAARDDGATRFCMGAAWRNVRDGAEFDAVVEMVRGVRALGMEACVTLGMLEPHQARRLADAGLTAYNHNLDSGPDFYPDIISTRTYEDRLRTLDAVESAGIGVCCGGIVGMGETRRDRVAMLVTLANRDPQPASVPINALVSVDGTPLGGRGIVDGFEVVRTVATARIAIPHARVRLSAGRRELGAGIQALAFLAGANSIFAGEKLLTTPNAERDDDAALFATLGLA
jgi:biotin synthase